MSAAPERVRVELGPRSYEVVVGQGLLDRAGELIAPILRRKRIFVISDRHVAQRHGVRLSAGLGAAGIEPVAITLPPGEGTKDWDHLGRLLDDLLDRRPERGDMLLALGGGVIGDLVGVAASLLLRGVDFIQAPTTLLAQVDSSVGGKTGVNTRHGKNLVGAFYQPRLVLADLDALATLPRRELLAGYAETAKYGLIDDPGFFAWCEANGAALVAGDAAARQYAVAHAVRAKARTVAADEREGGVRALLNLGHTFGHALEAAVGYSDALLHGEAVAIGMVLAFDLSVRLGLCPAEDAARVRRHLAAVGLPVDPPGGLSRSPAQLVELMGQDKKVRDGRIAFVLARGIGRAFLADDIDPVAVRDLLGRALAA
jgi:3-dehydroquinate synthase